MVRVGVGSGGGGGQQQRGTTVSTSRSRRSNISLVSATFHDTAAPASTFGIAASLTAHEVNWHIQSVTADWSGMRWINGSSSRCRCCCIPRRWCSAPQGAPARTPTYKWLHHCGRGSSPSAASRDFNIQQLDVRRHSQPKGARPYAAGSRFH